MTQPADRCDNGRRRSSARLRQRRQTSRAHSPPAHRPRAAVTARFPFDQSDDKSSSRHGAARSATERQCPIHERRCSRSSQATEGCAGVLEAASIALMDPRLVAAVQNNACWCDIVCRSHGVPTVRSEQLWVAPEGAPRLYPDAVTLAPQLAADFVLRGIDTGRGCSVKDSFADLDLSPHGFTVLFDGWWLFRGPASPRTRPRFGWLPVTNEDDLERWAVAAGLEGIIRPELLRDRTVHVLAVRDEQAVTMGAIITQTGATIGISNVFTTAAAPASAWRDLPAAVGDAIARWVRTRKRPGGRDRDRLRTSRAAAGMAEPRGVTRAAAFHAQEESELRPTRFRGTNLPPSRRRESAASPTPASTSSATKAATESRLLRRRRTGSLDTAILHARCGARDSERASYRRAVVRARR
jgi:hypothetical protein